ncbi:hypothetical protein [Corynebacterium sp. p3-SID1194]|uniref:hypothetical protein n=1 Tax=Corynebacterium sp. p3-SID1194 TaxID=2916105 RepID=UPI0021A409CD|nr:hypothetical protein [Corynebacterium sp. p3-SID1194]MCT1451012.1 hypothetical protein [Corynebacterium sp. p3-SID1194]
MLVHVGILDERLHVSDASIGEQPGDPAERREDVGDVEFRPAPSPSTAASIGSRA